MEPKYAMWCCLSSRHPGVPGPELYTGLWKLLISPSSRLSARHRGMSWGLAKQPSSQVQQTRSGVGRQGNICRLGTSEVACHVEGHQHICPLTLVCLPTWVTRTVSGADRMGAETGTEILDSWRRSIPELGACPPGAPRQLSHEPANGAATVQPLHAMPSHLPCRTKRARASGTLGVCGLWQDTNGVGALYGASRTHPIL